MTTFRCHAALAHSSVPSDCNPNPATCAVGSEALHSKVPLQGSPAALQAQVTPVSVEKIAQRAFLTAWPDGKNFPARH